MERIDYLINATQWGRLSAEEADEMRLELGNLRHQFQVVNEALASSIQSGREDRETINRLSLENDKLSQELKNEQEKVVRIARAWVVSEPEA